MGHRSSDSDSESVEAHIDVAPETGGRADEFALVTPGATAEQRGSPDRRREATPMRPQLSSTHSQTLPSMS